MTYSNSVFSAWSHWDSLWISIIWMWEQPV